MVVLVYLVVMLVYPVVMLVHLVVMLVYLVVMLVYLMVMLVYLVVMLAYLVVMLVTSCSSFTLSHSLCRSSWYQHGYAHLQYNKLVMYSALAGAAGWNKHIPNIRLCTFHLSQYQ